MEYTEEDLQAKIISLQSQIISLEQSNKDYCRDYHRQQDELRELQGELKLANIRADAAETKLR